MEGSSNKKRKLNDGAVANDNSTEKEYKLQPIRLRTVQADLEAIPRDILIRALVQYSRNNIRFIGEFNESIENAVKGYTGGVEEIDPLVGDNTSNEYELRQYSVTKIRAYINKLFDQYKYYKPEPKYNRWDDEEEVDKREFNYNRLITLLDDLLDKALHLSQAGEKVSAYIIMRTIDDIATLDKFESNGDLNLDDEDPEDVALELDMAPQSFVTLVQEAIVELEDDLTDEQRDYVVEKVQEADALLPKSENNQEAFDAFPLQADRVGSLFDAKSYSRSQEYVSKFSDIVSSIDIVSGQKIYQIQATVPAVSMRGNYKLIIQFDASAIKSTQCSCPMVNQCKHLAALMTRICRKHASNPTINLHTRIKITIPLSLETNPTIKLGIFDLKSAV